MSLMQLQQSVRPKRSKGLTGRWISAISGILLLSLGVSACGTAPTQPAAAPAVTEPSAPPAPLAGNSGPVIGGALTIGILRELSQLDPHRSGLAQEHIAYYGLYDRLTDIQTDNSVVPGLAESWEVSADGTVYTFKLRQGVQFHDGTEFNAAAVKFNVDRVMDPTSGSVIRSSVGSVATTEVVDNYTVKMTLKQPDYLFTRNLFGMNIVSPKALQDLGEDFSRNPVGTGPFRFKEWLRDDHMTMVRNQHYWRKDEAGRSLPYLDEVTLKPIPTASTLVANIQTGHILVTGEIDVKDLSRLQSNSELVVWSAPSTSYFGIRLKTTEAPFDKLEVRQALSMSVDRDALNRVLFAGFATPAYKMYPPAMLGFDPDYKPYQNRDLNMAKELLAKAGYPNGIDFTLSFANSAYRAWAELLQAQWGEIGARVKLEQIESGIALQRMQTRELQAYVSGVGSTGEPYSFYPAHFACGAPYNMHDWCNPEVDGMINTVLSIADPAERAKVYARAERILVEDAPVVFLFHPPVTRVYNSKVKGLVINQVTGRFEYRGVWLEGN